MTQAEIVERLAAHRGVGGAPREELAWLAAHGRLVHYEVGAAWIRKGDPIDVLHLILSGRFAIYMARGGSRKMMELGGGDVGGVLPYSRLMTSPVDAFAEEPSEVLELDRALLPELIQRCPVVTTALVHHMLDRARIFTASDMHDEKMMSLGRLAAGLAHELNNPASAAVRSAKLLESSLAEAEEASRALGATRLTEEQLAAIDGVRGICLQPPLSVESPIERADREEAIAEWLQHHGADPAAAASLAETSVDPQGLEGLAGVLSGETLAAAIRWIATGCVTRALAVDVERAASRMHALVSSVKRFTHMDRAPAPAPVDLGESLADVVAMVAAKARRKSVKMNVELEQGLPKVMALGGELNQVWLNLIDNALDAAPESGQVTVTVKRERATVVVRVVDNGAGIPAEIRSRIFDAFFTTKPVGQGTGLGLEIARRLVQGHQGELDFESAPGHTEFRVTLPVEI